MIKRKQSIDSEGMRWEWAKSYWLSFSGTDHAHLIFESDKLESTTFCCYETPYKTRVFIKNILSHFLILIIEKCRGWRKCDTKRLIVKRRKRTFIAVLAIKIDSLDYYTGTPCVLKIHKERILSSFVKCKFITRHTQFMFHWVKKIHRWHNIYSRLFVYRDPEWKMDVYR